MHDYSLPVSDRLPEPPKRPIARTPKEIPVTPVAPTPEKKKGQLSFEFDQSTPSKMQNSTAADMRAVCEDIPGVHHVSEEVEIILARLGISKEQRESKNPRKPR